MTYKKDFDKWNEKKKNIEYKNKEIHLKNRGIYWISIGENIGFEQSGKNKYFERPVLVIKVFNRNMFLGVPLTTGNKNKKSKYYFSLKNNGIEYFLILPQIRLFSTKRVLRFIRKIEIEEFKKIKKALKDLINL